ncbi:MAG: hypothetical protein ABDH63_01185 [Candidatus Caldarchaeales archaeon]
MTLAELLPRCGLVVRGPAARSLEGFEVPVGFVGPPESDLVVPGDLREPALYLIGRQALVESHEVVLALGLGLRELAELDARHAAVLVRFVGPEGLEAQVGGLGGPWQVEGGAASAVLLAFAKLASLMCSEVLSESGVRSEALSRVAREESESIEALIGSVGRSLVGSAQAGLFGALQGLRPLLERWFLVEGEANRAASVLLGGGTSEDSVELGSGRLASIQEEFHLRRVNALRSMGLDLLEAQKIAELPGGTVKPGWGC